MEYTISEVRNVLRNYEGLLVKKRGDQGREGPSKETNVSDHVQISSEGLRKLVELQKIGAVSNIAVI